MHVRRTLEDESDDRTSLNRALAQRLVLIVKPRTGDPWCLPESPWEVSYPLCLQGIVDVASLLRF